MNVFTRDRGVHQGRIRKANAPDGVYVYEIGHALLAQSSAAIGDFHAIETTFVRETQALYVRAALSIVIPETPPLTAAWEVSGWLNGLKVVSRRLRLSKRPLLLDDWRISLANSNPPPATNTLAFRLELVGLV